jgi:hypothetical protein
MQRLPFLVVVTFSSLALSVPLMAQQAMHAPDGGTMERVQSIDIPTTPNAPFRAVVTTEWTRIMPDGTTATMKNHRTVARDGSGRVFQERRNFTPNGDKQVTAVFELDYYDPNLHQAIVCRPDYQACTVYRYDSPAAATPTQAAATPSQAGAVQNGMSSMTQEPLGQKTVGGLELVGSREVTTLSKGAIGNEQPQPIVKEFWYSPELGINVSTKRMDPRASAIQDFEVGNISTGEPDVKLFQPPANYRVVKMDVP